MPKPLAAFTARRRPGQIAVVSRMMFFVYNLVPHPSGDEAKQLGRLTLCPSDVDGQIGAIGHLSLFTDPRAAWKVGSYMRMEAAVPSPYLVPTRRGRWLDRLAIFPEGDHAGHDLGPVVMDYLQPYFNTVGPIDREGLLRLDELISDSQAICQSYIPVQLVSYSPMCPTSLDFGPRGWDRSGTYTWETPVIDDGNAVEAVTPPLTIAINLTLPAIGMGEVAATPEPEHKANTARTACKAAAQAHHHQARRPAAKAAKRK